MRKTGFYGVINAHQGIVSNRLPQTFTAVWHEWARQLVDSCQRTDAAQIDRTWYQLPSYRFALSSGLAGENVWIGLMVPSQDADGHKFTCCLVRPLGPGALPAAALSNSDGYLQALESVAAELQTYDDARLAQTLDAIDQTHPVAEPDSSDISSDTTFQTDSDSLAIRLTTRLNDVEPTLLGHALLKSACGSYSLWQTSQISHCGEESLLCEGLPGEAACDALFSGNFSAPNWSNIVLANSRAQARATARDNIMPFGGSTARDVAVSPHRSAAESRSPADRR